MYINILYIHYIFHIIIQYVDTISIVIDSPFGVVFNKTDLIIHHAKLQESSFLLDL